MSWLSCLLCASGHVVHHTGISNWRNPVFQDQTTHPMIFPCGPGKFPSSVLQSRYSPKKPHLRGPQTWLLYVPVTAGSGVACHLPQPFHLTVDIVWSVPPQPHTSPKPTGAVVQASQLVIDPVVMHTSRCSSLVRATHSNPWPGLPSAPVYACSRLCCVLAWPSPHPIPRLCTSMGNDHFLKLSISYLISKSLLYLSIQEYKILNGKK